MPTLIPYAGAEIRSSEPPKPPAPPTLAHPLRPMPAAIAAIMEAVCHDHMLSVAELLGARRTPRYVRARRDFYVRCIAAGHSLNAAARALGRDHTSALYHYRRYQAGASTEPYVKVCDN